MIRGSHPVPRPLLLDREIVDNIWYIIWLRKHEENYVSDSICDAYVGTLMSAPHSCS